MTIPIGHRIATALSVTQSQGHHPARIWLSHADWDALTAAAGMFKLERVVWAGVPVTLDTYGQETRIIMADGVKLYF